MKKIIYLFITTTFLSCNFNANVAYENNESDKNEAESIAVLFYQYTLNKSYDSIPSLMSKDFYFVTNKNDLINFLKKKEILLGESKDLNLVDWKTIDVRGSDPQTKYILLYNVTYSKGQVMEKISLIKENGIIKINGYAVNLDEVKR